LEGQKDGSSQELLDLQTKNAELTEQVANMNITIENLKAKEVIAWYLIGKTLCERGYKYLFMVALF